MFQSVLRRLRESQTTELEGMGAAEAGFTLIELMVVLLIIAILLAIAIPTFLGVTSSANDRAAQSNLTNGLTEATAQYQNSGQSYSGISALLSASAPEFTWNASATSCTTATPNCISVTSYDLASTNDAQGLVIAAMSKTGTCWYVAQLQATPVVITSGETSPNVAFDSSASTPPVTGDQTNAGSAGTYYAKDPSPVSGATNNCNAAYPHTRSGGFSWGTSFSTAASNT
jgi:type IV pilus assembly protein PilA